MSHRFGHVLYYTICPRIASSANRRSRWECVWMEIRLSLYTESPYCYNRPSILFNSLRQIRKFNHSRAKLWCVRFDFDTYGISISENYRIILDSPTLNIMHDAFPERHVTNEFPDIYYFRLFGEISCWNIRKILKINTKSIDSGLRLYGSI